MKITRCSFLVAVALLGAGTRHVVAQVRKPPPAKSAPGKAPVKGKPGVKALPPPPPVEAARRVVEEEIKPPLIISKVKIKEPVLVFYQQAAPGTAVQQLLMEEKNLPLLKTTSLEDLVARREVFVDGLGSYDPPAQAAEAGKYRLAGVSQLANSDKRSPAPDGRSTYVRLKVPSPGELYVVRESAEDYRHFVSGPQKKGSRIDFEINGLPGVDSIRAIYTLRKIDQSERGGGEVIR
jgi:hypothetical protein